MSSNPVNGEVYSIKLKTKIHNSGHCRMVVGFITTYLSPPTLWVRIPHRWYVLDKTLCDKVCQWLATGRWFSPSTSVSFTNKTDRHNITEILLKVMLNIITLTLKSVYISLLLLWVRYSLMDVVVYITLYNWNIVESGSTHQSITLTKL